MDPITIGLQLGFFVLFGVSVFQFARHRGPLELSVVAIFGSFAALFLLSFLNALQPALTPVARPILVAIVFAQPYLIVRLLDQIRPVSRVVKRATIIGGVAAWEAIVLLPPIGSDLAIPALQPIGVVSATFYFFAVEIWAAARMALDSRRRLGVARVRLASAAIATGLYGAALLLAGLTSVMRAPSGAADSDGSDADARPHRDHRLPGRVRAARLVPPRREPCRLLPSGPHPRGTADRGDGGQPVDRSGADGTGDPRRQTRLDPGRCAGRTACGRRGSGAGQHREDEGRTRARPVDDELEVRPERAHGEHLIAEIEGRPLFVGDDLALLADLCSLTAQAIDREETLISLGEARREAEESRTVRASEARFRALLDADPNAILALDEDSRVSWATRQAGELFGAPVEKLAGLQLADLVAMHKDEASTATLDRPVFRSETTGRRIDGTHFPAEMARTTFELDGRPFQVAVISDVSWRHEADQIRDRFLGVLSHELRTPVTSIYGGTQLLLGRGARLDAETRNELLVGVAAEAERLQRMIENLVAMARIERGGDFGGARPVLLDRIIKQLVEREQALWPEVKIKLAANSPVQMVAADEEYLAQIMRNLLSNAAKYSGPGSTVEVSLEDAEGEVFVRVRDNGPGIDGEDSDRLFGLYYRAATASKTAPGAGIGLFVCRELVATMGGRIWARPLPEGGAEFGFSIPAYVDELDLVSAGEDQPNHVFDRAPEKTTPMPAGPAAAVSQVEESNGQPQQRKGAPAPAT